MTWLAAVELKVVTPVHTEPTAAVWAGSLEEPPTPYEDWVVVEVM